MEHETYTVLDNQQNLNAPQGAGIQAAQQVVDSGARTLVTGHLGPKAARVIQAAGIETFQAQSATVKEALDLFKSKALKQLNEADVAGHWV